MLSCRSFCLFFYIMTESLKDKFKYFLCSGLVVASRYVQEEGVDISKSPVFVCLPKYMHRTKVSFCHELRNITRYKTHLSISQHSRIFIDQCLIKKSI